MALPPKAPPPPPSPLLPPKAPPPPLPLHGVSGITWAFSAPRKRFAESADPTQVAAGVFGQTMNEGYGVLGFDNPNSVFPTAAIGGVTIAKQSGVGVYGDALSAGPDSHAGWFNGNVAVNGNVDVISRLAVYDLTAHTKNAIVPFPDGSKRLLHCMESPEHWFEDFGSARLTRGRATVKLDADFAKVVTLNGYRVFLTPEGDCHGLYVRSKRGRIFEVRELQGGVTNVAFSYCIVAKRKDIKRHRRFAKIDTTVPILKGAARAGRGRKTTRRPFSRRALFAALAKDARKKA